MRPATYVNRPENCAQQVHCGRAENARWPRGRGHVERVVTAAEDDKSSEKTPVSRHQGGADWRGHARTDDNEI
jgi:hypothetical protein